ncbi:RDD family protein [Paenisporosarcina cavernae]|uniref:RDD family protein n=2 Tax=Paenisporosarcina cavernae TaxID=2320858 RepID=A0A385YWF8_9BACL|nr:RDD family protein [Paenisporosarcina cavernae]
MDLLIIGSLTSIIVYPIFRIAGWNLSNSAWYAPISILSAIVFYGYFVLMTYFWRQTIGKMIFGLTVIPLKDDSNSFLTIVIREWIGRFISTTLFPLYVVVAFTSKKQGVHDLFADTSVIHENTFEKTLQRVPYHAVNSHELHDTNPI